MRVSRILPTLVLAVALAAAGCASPSASPGPLLKASSPKRTGTARELAPMPLPRTGTRALVASPGGGSLKGKVAFQVIDHPFFADNAAQRRLLATPMASAHAMLVLSSLEEDLYTAGGQVIQALSGADGTFTIADVAPGDRPYLVNAHLTQSQRLSAIVVPGMSEVTIDEASSMIAEMARWQLRPVAEAEGQPSLQDLTATDLLELYEDTLEVLAAEDFAATGTVPNIEVLKVGAGHELRNAYVKAFGAKTTAGGSTAADAISDAWAALLGYRPIALTRVAGNGIRNFNQGDAKPATEAELPSPVDAVFDAAGNMFITEQDTHRVRYVPATAQGPRFGAPAGMEAGKFYTVLGIENGPSSPDAYYAIYGETEASSAADPSAALAVDDPDPTRRPALFTPTRIVVETNESGTQDLFISSRFGNRVFFVPGENQTRFGRDFLANRLYRLVGDARFIDYAQEAPPDGVPAHSAAISAPTGLAQDSRGNLYFIDSEIGLIRLVRASDGMLFTLAMSFDGAPYTCSGAQDMRVREGAGGNFLYVADTAGHMVFRMPLPADLAGLDAAIPAETPIEPVLGVAGQVGYRDPASEGALLPHVYAFYDGIPEDEARLNSPVSLDFDADGRLAVAEKGRVRLVGGDGKVYTLAGGFDSRYLEGDARLGFFPDNAYLNFDPVSRTFLLVDRKENIVRRLWTGRGTH